MFKRCHWAATKLILILPFTVGASPGLSDGRALDWPAATRECRPWAYWWWLGSAVDKTNLTRELTRYRDAGMGGVHIVPIYGAKSFEDRYLEYLSPRWLEMMSHAVTEGQRLGLGVDMTTGTGWCFGGGPNVGEREGNALVVARTFDVPDGAKPAEKFDPDKTQALVAFGPNGQAVELTKQIRADGTVDWKAPSAGWRVYAISQKFSGQNVKRAAPGGEGPMLNLIYADAMRTYLRRFSAAFDHYPGAKPRAQYHDSYEYRGDWSPDFFAQFEKRRGYRLQTELPALFAKEHSEHSARVLCDYRETVSDILSEDSFPQWTQWATAHGFLTRNQAHGSPGNLLDLYALADIPETEMFNLDRNKLISKFASSAAHVAGRKLTSAETGTWLKEHFTETLADLKYLLDDMFLSGVNHVFYHGTCYSPDDAGWPGWLFYASTEMNPRNSIWRDVPALNAYIARCQSVLQSGQPDNDILLYWNTADFWMQPGKTLLPRLTVHNRDWFESQPIGKVAEELWENGYAFDYVSDAQLKTAKVVNRPIQMPGGREYDVILVPKCKYIPLETFKHLLALARQGAHVVFEGQLPSDISGLSSADRRDEFKRLTAQILFRPVSAGMRKGERARVGEGFIVQGDLRPALLLEAVGPQSQLAYFGLSSIRRRSLVGGWVSYNYFIANHSGTNFDGWISFFNAAYNNKMSAVLLDPMTGTTGVAAIRQNQLAEKIKEIRLQLLTGETVILRTFPGQQVEGPAWTYWQTNGLPMAVSGDWKVKFLEGGPVLPANFQTAKLASWTTFPDTNCQAFAGTAKYKITFAAPDSSGKTFELNLGDVRQSARVKLNGKDYGTLFTPPFRAVVSGLKPKDNLLEVEVTNVSANRIRDLDRRGIAWRKFHDINFVNLNYKAFDASDWPLTESGLIGPVTLTAASPMRPE